MDFFTLLNFPSASKNEPSMNTGITDKNLSAWALYLVVGSSEKSASETPFQMLSLISTPSV